MHLEDPLAAPGSREQSAPPLSRPRGSRGPTAPPRRPVCGEVGSAVCPGSGCLQLTAALKVAAAAASGSGGRPGARWRCGRELELAAAGPREPARGPPGEAGECEKLGVDPPAATASGLRRLWRFSPAPAPFALKPATGAGSSGLLGRRGWMELGRPTPVFQAQGHLLLGPSGKRAGAPVRGGEAEKVRGRSTGVASAWAASKRNPTPPRSSPWLAQAPGDLPSPGLDQGCCGEGSGEPGHEAEQLLPSCVCGAVLSPFTWLWFYFLTRETRETFQ